MEAFRLLLEFFFGKSVKAGYKAFAFLVIVAAVILINQNMGFTYNYYYSKKIENISRLQEMLNNEKLTTDQRAKLTEMQSTIIESTRALNVDLRNSRMTKFWYIMSYCGLLILAGLVTIVTSFINDMGGKRWTTIFGVVIIIVLLTGLMTAIGWLSAFIPSAAISYTINIIFQIINIWAIYYISTKAVTVKQNPV
jgi:hypothetical protein